MAYALKVRCKDSFAPDSMYRKEIPVRRVARILLIAVPQFGEFDGPPGGVGIRRYWDADEIIQGSTSRVLSLLFRVHDISL